MPILTWPSKKLTPPDPVPFIKESIIFPGGHGYPDTCPESRLILGNNLSIMSSLLPDYENRINLIYADPPFFTNRKYSIRIGRGEDSRKPEEWELAEGYLDHWSDLDAYLDFLYQRLALMYRLLAPNGTLYLHLDWHADSYARLLLDEFFGAENLLNEIVWVYHGPSPIRTAFNRKHDTLLAYVKGNDYTFNGDAVREPYNPSTLQTFKASPKAGFGKVPNLERGKVPEDWWYFPVVARLHNERTGYPTQKPEGLMERIILASSNPGDIVADFFCGSGTTPAVASRLGRKFLAADVTWRAVHTTRQRLVRLNTAPFTLERSQSVAWDVQQARPSAFKLHLSDNDIRLASRHKLDYWEVDPAWDEKIFISAAQAFRPVRSDGIPTELKIKTGRNVCIRLVTAQGRHYQIESNV